MVRVDVRRLERTRVRVDDRHLGHAPAHVFPQRPVRVVLITKDAIALVVGAGDDNFQRFLPGQIYPVIVTMQDGSPPGYTCPLFMLNG